MASYLTLSEIPTLTQLYRTKVLKASSNVLNAPLQPLNNIISHIRHDITKLQVGCIVNAANSSLLGGGGVDGSIHRAAGPKLLEECETLGGCNTGDAKMTAGYELPANQVAHTVGPVYFELESDVAEKLLRSCYRRSLELAVEHEQRSIAFPAISTGVYGYPHYDAATAAIDEVGNFLRKGDNLSKFDRVIFCSFMNIDRMAYEAILPSYFPPTPEDLATAAAEDNKDQTQDDAVFVDGNMSDTNSEYEWQEVSKIDESGHEYFEDDVEHVAQTNQESSVIDVRSMQSSTTDFDDLGSEAEIKK